MLKHTSTMNRLYHINFSSVDNVYYELATENHSDPDDLLEDV